MKKKQKNVANMNGPASVHQMTMINEYIDDEKINKYNHSIQLSFSILLRALAYTELLAYPQQYDKTETFRWSIIIWFCKIDNWWSNKVPRNKCEPTKWILSLEYLNWGKINTVLEGLSGSRAGAVSFGIYAILTRRKDPLNYKFNHCIPFAVYLWTFGKHINSIFIEYLSSRFCWYVCLVDVILSIATNYIVYSVHSYLTNLYFM